MADNAFRWLDDGRNFTKRADMRKGFDDFFATPEGRMDAREMRCRNLSRWERRRSGLLTTF